MRPRATRRRTSFPGTQVDFRLDEEQRLLKDSVERFIRERYGPGARAASLKAHGGWSRATWSEFIELGLVALPFSVAHGGLDAGPVASMIVLEAFGRGLVVEPFLASVVLAGGVLRHAAPSAQVGAAIGAMLEGREQLAFAHGEADARHDLNHVSTTATAQEGGWRIAGAKHLVLHGGSADRLVVSARMSGAQRERDGIALFLVDAGLPGVSRRDYALQDGTRAADVRLDDVRVDLEAMLAGPQDGAAILERVTHEAIAAVCAEAIGVMEAMLALTLEYLKTRTQFGVALGSFQVLQHRAVDMQVALEQARSMALYAAMMTTHVGQRERGAAMAAAKIQIGRSGRLIAQQAIQLHGGMGMSAEYALGHYVKRMLVLETLFGDAAHHLSALAAAGGLEPEDATAPERLAG